MTVQNEVQRNPCKEDSTEITVGAEGVVLKCRRKSHMKKNSFQRLERIGYYNTYVKVGDGKVLIKLSFRFPPGRTIPD